MRLLVQCSLLLAFASAFGAGTKVVEGKLEAMSEGGDSWVLRIGAEAVPVAPEKKTRFWAKKGATDAKAFHVGDLVVARIAPDESPAALREIADKDSWAWLESIRKGIKDGTVKGYDGKRLTMALSDGTEMAYRATEKSKIVLEGKPATLGDLKTGQKLWLKGRTLPTLDVWLVQASDHAIVAPVKKPTKRAAASKPRKIPASGKLTGEIFLHMPVMRMFDLTVDGVTMHVTYFDTTSFTFGGAKCGPGELITHRQATITYRRDGFGRIGATKVEIR